MQNTETHRLDTERLNFITSKTNRSKQQTQFLFDLLNGDYEMLKRVEEQIKNCSYSVCPSNMEEVNELMNLKPHSNKFEITNDPIIAKRDFQISESLMTHSNNVYKNCMSLCDKYLDNSDYKEIVKEILKHVSYLHDIGKIDKNFQNYINNNNIDSTDGDSKYIVSHNLMSYFFIKNHLILKSNTSDLSDESLKNIVNAIVLYHHSLFMSEINIDSKQEKHIKNTSAEILKNDYLSEISEIINVSMSSNKRLDYKNRSEYFVVNGNTETIDKNNILIYICRSIFYMADSYSFNDSEILDVSDSIVKTLIESPKLDDIKFPFGGKNKDNIKRFEEQKNIAKKAVDNITSFVDASAGFGKTMLSLKWFFELNNGKKLIMVCPNNQVTISLYKTVKNNIELLQKANNKDGNNIIPDNISIEKYHTSEIKETVNNDSGKPFTSDIIITNIDSFLKPTITKESDLLFTMLNSNVVFDEYHEYNSNVLLLNFFDMILKIRENHFQSNSLLISATNDNMHTNLFSDPSIINNINPYNKVTKFKFHFYDNYADFQNEFLKNKSNRLFISNSINQAIETQKSCERNSLSSRLYHSRYKDDHKQDILNSIYDNYGSDSKSTKDYDIVTSSPILEISHNISFESLFTIFSDVTSLIQRIGRVNRFKEYKKISHIHVFNPFTKHKNSKNKGELMAISNTKGNLNRCKTEYEKFVSVINTNKSYTVKEINDIYSNIKAEEDIIHNDVDRFNNNLSQSFEMLKYVLPLRLDKNRKKLVKADSNILRKSFDSSGIYALFKNDNKNVWELLQINIYGKMSLENISKNLNLEEFNSSRNEYVEIAKNLFNNGYDFSVLKEKNIENTDKFFQKQLKHKFRSPTSPFISLGMVYNDKYGLIKKQ